MCYYYPVYIAFLLLITVVVLAIYVVHLRNKVEELKNLQLMITLLQEQTLFLNDIEPVKYILEQEGDLNTVRLDEVKKELSKAYRDGFYLLDPETKKEILAVRENAEKLLMMKVSIKKFETRGK